LINLAYVYLVELPRAQNAHTHNIYNTIHNQLVTFGLMNPLTLPDITHTASERCIVKTSQMTTLHSTHTRIQLTCTSNRPTPPHYAWYLNIGTTATNHHIPVSRHSVSYILTLRTRAAPSLGLLTKHRLAGRRRVDIVAWGRLDGWRQLRHSAASSNMRRMSASARWIRPANRSESVSAELFLLLTWKKTMSSPAMM